MCSAPFRVTVKLGFYSLQIHALPDSTQGFIPPPSKICKNNVKFSWSMQFRFLSNSLIICSNLA